MSPHGKNAWKMPALTISLQTTSHCETGIVSGGKVTSGQCYPNTPHLPLIMDLKAIEVWCRWPHQYHHSLTDQKAPGIPILADVTGRLEAT